MKPNQEMTGLQTILLALGLLTDVALLKSIKQSKTLQMMSLVVLGIILALLLVVFLNS